MLEVRRCPPGPPRAALLPRPPSRLACPAQSMCPIDVPPCPVQVLRLLGSNPSKGEFADMLKSIDTNQDGVVSWLTFSEWNRRNSVEDEIWKQVRSTEDELRKQLRELGITPRV